MIQATSSNGLSYIHLHYPTLATHPVTPNIHHMKGPINMPASKELAEKIIADLRKISSDYASSDKSQETQRKTARAIGIALAESITHVEKYAETNYASAKGLHALEDAVMSLPEYNTDLIAAAARVWLHAQVVPALEYEAFGTYSDLAADDALYADSLIASVVLGTTKASGQSDNTALPDITKITKKSTNKDLN